MKKAIIIFISVIICHSKSVANTGVPNEYYFAEGTKWTTSVESYDGCGGSWMYTAILQGETLIGGKTYRMINRPIDVPIIEDGQKIYAHIGDADYLLYDFSLVVGDSIPLYYFDISSERQPIAEDNGYYTHVIAVDSITLSDGRRAKRIWYDHRWVDIEYVGNENGILSPIIMPDIATCWSVKACCSLNGEPIFENIPGFCGVLDLHSALPKEEEITPPSATKFLRDGQLLINHNGNTYNANGVLIRNF